MGRPIEYKEDEVLAKTREYLNSCVDKKYKLIKTEGDKSTSWEHKVKVNIPTIEGLAVYLKIHRDTVYDWNAKYPNFSDILAELMQEQANRLLSNGLSGDYNSTIAKLILTKHGYRDAVDSDLTSKGEKVQFGIINYGDNPA